MTTGPYVRYEIILKPNISLVSLILRMHMTEEILTSKHNLNTKMINCKNNKNKQYEIWSIQYFLFFIVTLNN